MKIKTIYSWIMIAIFIFFAIVGGSTLSIVVHEYQHFYALHKYAQNDSEELCGLVLPTQMNNVSAFLMSAGGYYKFYSIQQDNETFQAELDKIETSSEIKAYALTALVFVVLFACMMIIFDRMFELYILKSELKKLGITFEKHKLKQEPEVLHEN